MLRTDCKSARSGFKTVLFLGKATNLTFFSNKSGRLINNSLGYTVNFFRLFLICVQ